MSSVLTSAATDFVFIVMDDDGWGIDVHKSVVGAGSDALHAIVYGLSSGDQPDGSSCGGVDRMEVNGILTTDFTQIVNYLYQKEFTITPDNAIDIMHCADFLGLTALRDRCSQLIVSHLNYDTCLPLFAHLHAISAHPELYALTLRLIRYSPVRLAFEHRTWPDQTPAAVRTILASPAINSSELPLFEALLRWAYQRCQRRRRRRRPADDAVWSRAMRTEIGALGDCIRWSTLGPRLFDAFMRRAPYLYDDQQRRLMRAQTPDQRQFLTHPSELFQSQLACTRTTIEPVWIDATASSCKLFYWRSEHPEWHGMTRMFYQWPGAFGDTFMPDIYDFEWVPFDPAAVVIKGIPPGVVITDDINWWCDKEENTGPAIWPNTMIGRVAKKQSLESTNHTKMGDILYISFTQLHATYVLSGKPIDPGVQMEVLVGPNDRNVHPLWLYTPDHLWTEAENLYTF